MVNVTRAKAILLTGLVDSAFSGDRPTSISQSLYLAARRSSLLLAKSHEQLNIYIFLRFQIPMRPCNTSPHATQPEKLSLARYLSISVSLLDEPLKLCRNRYLTRPASAPPGNHVVATLNSFVSTAVLVRLNATYPLAYKSSLRNMLSRLSVLVHAANNKAWTVLLTRLSSDDPHRNADALES